jgi:DMSO/TMAO reductase YedYZ molybdopterin-dependent catalytic subunit
MVFALFTAFVSAQHENPGNSSFCPVASVAQYELPCPGNSEDVPLPGKPGVRVLPIPGTKPDPTGCALNAEGKPELLGLHDITPIENMYTRNHGNIPARAVSGSLDGWSLTIDGEVDKPTTFTMDDLKTKFATHSGQYVLECAGNGRHGYRPEVAGNQWTIGAVGNANWTGVLLKDVLQSVGVNDKAVYIGWYSEDAACGPGQKPGELISRGVPIEKAMDGYTMLAHSMNGAPLNKYHGFPLRLVAPGFPGAAWGKWLTRIWVRNQTHDGAKMAAPAYRVPIEPIAPGQHDTTWPGWNNDNMKIITQMNMKALITKPARCGSDVWSTSKKSIDLAGKAWSGAGDITKVEVSIDHGSTWLPVGYLSKPANKWAWQTWTVEVQLPSPGIWQIFARATDEQAAQPIIAPYWNPKGYMNNGAMSLTVNVTGV